MKKLFLEKDVYKDRESQIEAIEGTFEAAKKPVTIPVFFLFLIKFMATYADWSCLRF